MTEPGAYSGVDNLDIMEGAERYRNFLNGAIARVAGPPRPDLALVDYGAGTANHAVDLRDRGFSVACLEPDRELRGRVEGLGFTTYASPGEVPDQSVDLVYSLNVLEHIEDDAGALRDIVRMLKPGGRTVLYVPAFQVLYSSMDHKVGHLRRYRRRPFTALVRAAGITITSCRYVDSLGYAATLAYKVIGSSDGDLNEHTVRFYDRYLFPVSRAIDHATGTMFGKNLLLTGTRA